MFSKNGFLHKKIHTTTNKGFTLIELLVVIAIIGMLSAIILGSLNSARKKARISTRIANLRTIQTALERYYDTNGSYPGGATAGWLSECAAWNNAPNANAVIPGLAPTYLPQVPADPSMVKASNQNCLVYVNWGPGSQDYKLMDLGLTDETASDFAKYPGMVEPEGGHTPWSGNGVWSIYTPACSTGC